ncbi:ribosome small subunit-dependent GTPase A [Spiroplasma endosymbiont of 'Nebria riversi']|uniref:ribosome small subunit-dependent GTPase A n=1 Tax=Spiroplasma endosymbiont of 'Nebria riversi' TaxID=2792084 RepID=UPI001C0422F1|nr:ribosome small subunit-dependent GTPase A [Spiroplasma endosymbiont of 'Nebria riversi']
MIGLVIRVISEFCNVIINNEIYHCQARGVLRLSNQKILVGDVVTIEVINEQKKQATIIEIHPRKNQLMRPAVSNIDQVIIVSALKQPNFSNFLLNKYLIWVEAHSLAVVLVFTKADLLLSGDKVYDYIYSYKKLGYECLTLSINQPSNQWEKLKEVTTDKISILSGQTGVGKSSILNMLDPQLKIRTQEISKALNRGKHTTTYNELIIMANNIRIIDSPGFSSFSLNDISLSEIAGSFRFFKKFLVNCHYRRCRHWKEPKCGVKQALINKDIPQFIYDDYIKVLEQKQLQEKGRY